MAWRFLPSLSCVVGVAFWQGGGLCVQLTVGCAAVVVVATGSVLVRFSAKKKRERFAPLKKQEV